MSKLLLEISIKQKAIRTTYANHEDQDDLKYQVFFAVAASLDDSLVVSIRQENAIHNDIIQWNFTDSYENLIIKSTAIMKWASVNCDSSEFIIKADDDVYINIYNLIKRKNILSNYAKRRNRKLIFGRRGDINPVRDPKGKWYLPTSIYSNFYLPEYITGVAYIVSTVTCDSLFRAVIDSTPAWRLKTRLLQELLGARLEP